jgi:hypothetical protein
LDSSASSENSSTSGSTSRVRSNSCSRLAKSSVGREAGRQQDQQHCTEGLLGELGQRTPAGRLLAGAAEGRRSWQ